MPPASDIPTHISGWFLRWISVEKNAPCVSQNAAHGITKSAFRIFRITSFPGVLFPCPYPAVPTITYAVCLGITTQVFCSGSQTQRSQKGRQQERNKQVFHQQANTVADWVNRKTAFFRSQSRGEKVVAGRRFAEKAEQAALYKKGVACSAYQP